MKCTRRSILLAGLGLLVAGCETASKTVAGPRPFWPSVPPPSTGSGRPSAYGYRPPVAPQPRPTYTRSPVVAPPPVRVQAIPRSSWTSTGPLATKVNPMNGVSRITVHHEGWTAFYPTDRASTAQRIEQIRRTHTDAPRGWGDIGYHYIVDRAGRVWEGRAVAYQGAHVKGENEHNIGVLVLGNFEQQSPTNAQLGSLSMTLATLLQQFRVPVGRVYTHRELNATACPGRYLQPRVDSIRSQSLA